MADAVLVRTIQKRLQKIRFWPSVCWVLACLPCLALAGCSQAMNPMGIRPVITVYVGIPGFDEDDGQSEQFLESEKIIFGRIPTYLENADVNLEAFPEDKLADLVAERNQYGLGPDLIVSSELTARQLRSQELLRSFEVDKVLPWAERYKIVADILSVESNTYYSLPVFIESQFACGNKQLIESMPAKIEELPAAELNSKAPFSVNNFTLSERFYIENLLGVGQELLKIIVSRNYELDEGVIPDYIRYLKIMYGKEVDILKEEDGFKWSSLPNKFYFDRGIGDRRLRDFEKGVIAWMPCRNSAIDRLDRTMEGNLLVSLLPGQKEGVPAIGNPNVMVVSMGKQSSAQQKDYAFKWIEELIGFLDFRNNSKYKLSKYLSLEEFELHQASELNYFLDIKEILNRSSRGNTLPSTVLKDGALNRVYWDWLDEFNSLNVDIDEKAVRKYVGELRDRLSPMRGPKLKDPGDP